MQEQARLSNLFFPDTNNVEMPQWNSDSWPPLLGGWRQSHKSVVVNGEEKEQQTIVVIGGLKKKGATKSVLLMDLDKETKEWREGPRLNERRVGHAAVVCNGSVYALGGSRIGQYMDSIEQIGLLDLNKSPSTTNDKKPWTVLNCTLSTSRCGCEAAVIYNRFIVVVGGVNKFFNYLSSTDIIDTTVQTQHSVIAGPSMTVPRSVCGMAVVGQFILAIGGTSGSAHFNSVEYLEFMDSSPDSNADVKLIFPSSSKWKVHKGLVLSVPRKKHAVAKVGTCLIVTGGDTHDTLKSAEVLDMKRNVVYKLPDMTVGRDSHSVVSLSDRIVVIGGHRVDTCDTLALIDMQERTKVRLLISQATREMGLKDSCSVLLRQCGCFFLQNLANMYSCRAQIDMELEKLNGKIQLASRDRSKLKALQEAIEAESLLPVLEWLRDHDDKFRSVQELQGTIDELKGKLQDIDGFVGCLSIARKIEELEQLVELNVSLYDEENVADQKAEVEVKSDSR